MTVSKRINKFSSRVPPDKVQHQFERLGFEPVLYGEGSPKSGVRKNVLQLYQHCQWFVSELDDARPETVQILGNTERDTLDSEIVDQELIRFLRLEGPEFFSSYSKIRKSYPDLTLYAAEYSDESLLLPFKPLRRILQYLAYLLDKRASRRHDDSCDNQDPDASTSCIEDLHQSETDSQRGLHGTESRDRVPESSETENLNNSKDPDYCPSWIEEPESDDKTAQGGEATDQSPQLSRTEIRRATLEYQELPPRRHSRRKRDPLVLKIPPGQLRNLVDEQHLATLPQNSTHSEDSDPTTMLAMPHPLPSNPALSTSHVAPASPLSELHTVGSMHSIDWQDGLFQAMHSRNFDKASEDDLEKSYTQTYTSEWYKANDPSLPQAGEPKWGEMAQALGIWNKKHLCDEIRLQISTLHGRLKELWPIQYKEYARQNDSSVLEQQNDLLRRLVDTVANDMDNVFAKSVMDARPNCNRTYRTSCWQRILTASLNSNNNGLKQARDSVSFSHSPKKLSRHQDSKQQSPKASTNVFDLPERKDQIQSPSKSTEAEIAPRKQASKSAGGEIASRKSKRDYPNSLPKRSDQMLDRLRRSREDEPTEKQSLGQNAGHPSAAHNGSWRVPQATTADKEGLKTTSVATTSSSNAVRNVGQKRQQDQIEPGFEGTRSPEKRAKPNGDFSRSFQRSQSTASKRAIEIILEHGPVHFKLKADHNAPPLHTTTSMRREDFEITFEKLQNEYDGPFIRMRVSVHMHSGVALDPESVDLERQPSKKKLKSFLGQPALQANLEEERIFLVEPVGIKSYLDDISDDEDDDDGNDDDRSVPMDEDDP